MVSTSFYGDGETYSTAVVTSNDQPGSTAPSQAPSGFYPGGNLYNEADVSITATYASNAALSAAAAAASAASAASALQALAGTLTPTMAGTAAVGVSTKWAHEDHVHPTDTTRASVAYVDAQDATKAPLASPALTGAPTAPTPPNADNSTQIATTAWVQTNAPGTPPATVAPLMNGTAAVGVATKYAREDHVHPTDTSRAPLASPTFTGSITSPVSNISPSGAGSYLNLNAPAAATYQASINFNDNGVLKWQLGKDATNRFYLWDNVAAASVLQSTIGSGYLTAATPTAGDNSTKLATTAYVATALTGFNPGRVKLSAARTYYVSTTGSNSNDGLTAGTPFLTIQKAYDTITQTLDMGGQNGTIQCASGTYDGLNITSPWTGGGTVTLDLGGGTINGTTVVLQCSVPLPGVLTVQNGTLTTSSNLGLITFSAPGTMNIGTITLSGTSSIGNDMVTASANGYLHFIGNITFGACSGWREVFYARIAGVIDLYGSFSQTMTMTANMSWTDSFVYADPGGILNSVAGARTISTGGFTMTGKRYTTSAGGLINTNGGGTTYFPGSIAGGGSGVYA